MLALFVGMSACPPDPEGAADFREAIKGYSLKQIAGACDVNQSLVTKWCATGNVPDSRKRMLPPEALRRLRELEAQRDGVVVIERDMVKAIGTFVLGLLRPDVVKASLGSTNEPWNGAERRRALVA